MATKTNGIRVHLFTSWQMREIMGIYTYCQRRKNITKQRLLGRYTQLSAYNCIHIYILYTYMYSLPKVLFSLLTVHAIYIYTGITDNALPKMIIMFAYLCVCVCVCVTSITILTLNFYRFPFWSTICCPRGLFGSEQLQLTITGNWLHSSSEL